MNNPQFFEHEDGELVVFTHNGRGYVALVEIETIVPDHLKTDAEIAAYLLEDYEDRVD
jgi:hypothetical protein